MRSLTHWVLLGALSLAVAPSSGAQGLPPGYVDELFVGGWNGVICGAFDANGRMYVGERSGRVYLVENGVRLPGSLIDISDEVGNWRDFGMLSIALDPDFLVNGYYYLYYVVDRHHLLHHGTQNYNPGANEYYSATLGRITRYTADAQTNFTTTVPGSRFVLLGESPGTGPCILHESHGTGAILFGEDGTLLASTGDGASYTGVDAGSHGNSYWIQALANGIIRPAENVGAFRAQMIGSLNGKILRLDPATGDGVPSNPFYDASDPRAARSRVWCLGLRNPFRMTLRPGTGNPDPQVADPGALYVGDVGWDVWEDIHVAIEGGMNFGWPLFEGLTPQFVFPTELTENLDAPNPLYGTPGCDVPFFRFQDLLKQEQLDHSPSFPNPCDPSQEIPPSTPTFMHRRPVLDYRHFHVITRIPIFSGNAAAIAFLGNPSAPVAGQPFWGNCSVAGIWHSGLGLDPVYRGLYFHMDFARDWLRAIRFDSDDVPTEVLGFGMPLRPVFLIEDPADGSLIYLPIQADELRRIRFTGNSNVPPQAVIAADRRFGASPLTVRFDATGSSDPEDALLSFEWDFGDGGSSSEPSPLHTFSAAGGPTTFTVTLTVTDDLRASDSATYDVSLDNTPPQVEITSFVNGSTYSTQQTTTLPLEAEVSDAEHAPGELDYEWRVALHHNIHAHPQPPDPNPVTSTILSPTPCTGEFYAFHLELTVTDPAGLATQVDSWVFPDCASSVSVSLDQPAAGTIGLPNQELPLEATLLGPVDRVEFYVGSDWIGERTVAPFTIGWTPAAPGTYVLTALAVAPDGSSASSPGRVIEIREPARFQRAIAASSDDGEERLDGSMDLTGEDLELTLEATGRQTVGLRFQLDVPREATITSAHVQFTAAQVGSGSSALTVRAEAADDAAPITADDFDLSSRATTQASVAWTPEDWRYVQAIGARQRTPDLREALQEVVDRAGWQSGGSVLVLITGVGERTAESFDGEPEPPLLVVEHGVPAALIGTNYCTPNVPNSTGQPGSITATGSDVVVYNDLSLTATSLPQDRFAYFLASPTQSFTPMPGASVGNFCLGMSDMLGRYNELVQNTGTEGRISISVDLTAIPIAVPPGAIAIQPGDTWNFQGWHRDETGPTSNFTDAVSVMFL